MAHSAASGAGRCSSGRAYLVPHLQPKHAADDLQEEDHDETFAWYPVYNKAEQAPKRLQQNHDEGEISEKRHLNLPGRGKKQNCQPDPEANVNSPEFVVAVHAV